MPKLHELLAVASPLETQAQKTRAELADTFDKKRHHFVRVIKTSTQVGADAQPGQPPTTEEHEMQTTVKHEIKWVSQFLQKALDAAYQVDEGNTQARADIVLEDGTVVLEHVPSTFLLQLEKRLTELREFVGHIPTLDPAKGFKWDEHTGTYQAQEQKRIKGKKVQRALVLYPATDKHPAQTQIISEDVPDIEERQQEWSGLITPSDKGKLLERVEELSRAVKRARSRANEAEVDTAKNKVGQRLLRYVFQEYI